MSKKPEIVSKKFLYFPMCHNLLLNMDCVRYLYIVDGCLKVCCIDGSCKRYYIYDNTDKTKTIISEFYGSQMLYMPFEEK